MVKCSFRRSFPALSRIAGLALLIGTATGCRREAISVYDVPKEVKATGLPAGWEELPADQMRIGNYVVHGKAGEKAQVTIVALPGSGGSELDNVNRWRGQVGLSPQTQDQMSAAAVPITVAGEPARMFEISNTNRMLAAWQDHNASRWFFKMVGDDALVQQQKPVFTQFCRDYRYPDSASAVSDSGNSEQPVQPAAPTASEPAPTQSPSQWNAPPEWKPQTPGPMQDAKFSAAGGKAIITISVFEGPTGGVLANVNRWRSQIGLASMEEAGLSSLVTNLDSSQEGAKLIDMNGSQQRLVAAIVPLGAKTAFFKLLGEPAAVGSEKDRFVTFVKSTK